MKTRAVRLYGRRDLRLEEFELPPLRAGEVLARLVCDGVCMSTWKECEQGTAHKKVPPDIATRPIIIGHEFAGEILEVGTRWKGRFTPGQRFAVQVAIRGGRIPGYAYPHVGGAATHIIVPEEVVEQDCLIPVELPAHYLASLAEPLSCIVRAFEASYHVDPEDFSHRMGLRPGGRLALLGAGGPMGLCSLAFALALERRPSFIALGDRDPGRLRRAAALLPPERARAAGVELKYIETPEGTAESRLRAAAGGAGYDDAFVFAPDAPLLEAAGQLLAHDGCLNFFAGPAHKDFAARLNFYDVHYSGLHVAGTSGGNAAHMRRALDIIAAGAVDPSLMITHVGGLDSVIATTLDLPAIPGGKKLIYTGMAMDLVALADLRARAADDARYGALAELVEARAGLWSPEAERCLLESFGAEPA